MRKFILISSLLLASVSAHAGPTSDRGLVLAAADTPAATTTTTAPGTDTAQPAAQPLPPATETDAAKDAAKPQTADAPKPRASKPRSHQARHYEGDEAKARRIAAKYGISW